MKANVLLAFAMLLIFFEYAGANSLILPEGVEQEKYCEGCVKMVEGIEKLLKKKRDNTMGKILENVPTLCGTLGDEDARKICNHIALNHEDDIEKLRNDDKKKDKILAWLCYESTFACSGVKKNKSIKQDGDDDKLVEALKNMDHVKRVPNPVRASDEL